MGKWGDGEMGLKVASYELQVAGLFLYMELIWLDLQYFFGQIVKQLY